MKYRCLAIVALTVLAIGAGNAIGAEWKIPASAPLLTPWAREVSPASALPEYPGVLDQGYWPDGIYTGPTDAALRFDIE